MPLLSWSNVPQGGISSVERLVGLDPRVLFPPQFKLQKRPHYNQELTSYLAEIVVDLLVLRPIQHPWTLDLAQSLLEYYQLKKLIVIFLQSIVGPIACTLFNIGVG